MAEHPQPAAAPTPHERPLCTPMEEYQRQRRPVSLPDNLKHLQDHAAHTKAGLSLHEGAGLGGDRVKAVPYSAMTVAPDPRRYTVDIHGSTDNVRVGDTKLTPKELADIIRATGDWDGKQPIRLLSCQTGTKPDGFAAQLSRELGVEVVAPTKDAWVDDMGNVFASSTHHDTVRGDNSPGWPPNGEWATFKPDGTTTKHDKPAAPGTTPTWGNAVPDQKPRAWRRGEPTVWVEGPGGWLHEVPASSVRPPHQIRGNEAPQWAPNQGQQQHHRQPPPPPGAPAPGRMPPRPPQGGPVPQRFPQNTANQGGAQQHRPQFDPRQQQSGPDPRQRQSGFDPRSAAGPQRNDPRHGQQHPDPRHTGQPQAQPRPMRNQQHPRQFPAAGQQPGRPYSQHQPGRPQQQAHPFTGQPRHDPAAGQHRQAGPNQQHTGRLAPPPGGAPPPMRPNAPMPPVPMRGNPQPPARVPLHGGNGRPDWQQHQQAPRDFGPRPDATQQQQAPVQHTTPTRDLAPPVPMRTDHTPPSSEPAADTPKRPKTLDEMNDWERLEHARMLYAADHPELSPADVMTRTSTLQIGPDGRFIETSYDDPGESRQQQLEKRMNASIQGYLGQRNRGEDNQAGGRVASDEDLTFEPGGELPPSYTRSVPPGALDGAPSVVDLSATDYRPVFRDVQDVKQMLRQPFFRLDPGSIDAIHQGEGVAPGNPANMSMGNHVSGGAQAMVDGKLVSGTGYVSYSTSEEHVATRNKASVDFDEKTDVKVREGLYKRVERITEAYHPNGISTDHTDRDNNMQNASNKEGEYLFPGGMGNEYVYRTWERVTYFDDKGDITDQYVGDPQENLNFKWLKEIREIEQEMQR